MFNATNIFQTDAEEEQEKAFTKKPIKVKLLTEPDLLNYTIYDVVLPLPGYDIDYPDNVVKTWYGEILEEHGLSLDMPKQKVKYVLNCCATLFLFKTKTFF